MTRQDPVVSVVVATHNRCDLLQQTVASVLGQTVGDFELIVVDDCSSDGTWEWVSGLSDERVRPFRLEQHGERSTARNTGLRAARGQYVLFLDDDDLLTDRALETHLHHLRAHPSALGSIASLRLFDTKGGEAVLAIIDRARLQNIWQDTLFGWAACCGQILFRTQVVRSANGFDPSHSFVEDHVLLLQLTRLGPFVLVPDVALRYRLHPGTARPLRIWALMHEVRGAAVAGLRGKERRLGERILDARSLLRSTGEARTDRRHRIRTPWTYLQAYWAVASMYLGSALMRFELANSRSLFRWLERGYTGWDGQIDLSVRGRSNRDGRFAPAQGNAEALQNRPVGRTE